MLTWCLITVALLCSQCKPSLSSYIRPVSISNLIHIFQKCAHSSLTSYFSNSRPYSFLELPVHPMEAPYGVPQRNTCSTDDYLFPSMLQVSYKYFQADFRGPRHTLWAVLGCQHLSLSAVYVVCVLGLSVFMIAAWPWPAPLLLETIPTRIMDGPVFAWTQPFCYCLVLKSDVDNVWGRGERMLFFCIVSFSDFLSPCFVLPQEAGNITASPGTVFIWTFFFYK